MRAILAILLCLPATMHDPYAPPTSNTLAEPAAVDRRIRWTRLFVWSLLLLVTPTLVQIAIGIVAHYRGSWFGDDAGEISVNAFMVQWIAVGVGYFPVYLGLLWQLRARRLAHAAAAFFIVETTGTLGHIALGMEPAVAFSGYQVLRHAAPALLATGTAWLLWRDRR